MGKPESGIRNQKAASSRKRPVVKRGLPPTVGADNLIVLKKGEDLRSNINDRLESMKADFEKIEFFWSKIIRDPQFNETREYPELSQLAAMWELREGVRNFQEYKTKMKRLKTLLDHFQPGVDYELTVSEVAEILS